MHKMPNIECESPSSPLLAGIVADPGKWPNIWVYDSIYAPRVDLNLIANSFLKNLDDRKLCATNSYNKKVVFTMTGNLHAQDKG